MLDIQEIKKKSLRGGALMLLRQILVKALTLLTNIIVARTLFPEDFGVFCLASAAVGFMHLVGDVGLGASLIRQPTEPTEREQNSIFTVQQALLALTTIILILAAPYIAAAFHVPPQYTGLIYLLGIGQFIAGLRTIPVARLERGLNFALLSRVEIWQCVMVQLSTIALATAGFKAWSLGISAVIGQIVSTAILFLIDRPKLYFVYDREYLRSALGFGLKFQTVGWTNAIKDNCSTLFLGAICGPIGLGLLQFAGTIGYYSLWLSQAVSRVYFPSFAMVAQDKEALEKFVLTAIQLNNIIVVGFNSVLFPTASLVIPFIFGAKWTTAITLIYMLGIANIAAACTDPLFAMCNAIDKPQLNLRYSIIWTVMQWAYTIPLVLNFGITGFGYTLVLLALTSTPMFMISMRRETGIRVFRTVLPIYMAGIGTGFTVYGIISMINPTPLLCLSLIFPFGLLLFAGLTYALCRRSPGKLVSKPI